MTETQDTTQGTPSQADSGGGPLSREAPYMIAMGYGTVNASSIAYVACLAGLLTSGVETMRRARIAGGLPRASHRLRPS
ncbi:MAG TPA: hypothetical protein PJ986_15445 [Gammaproteobacteria bacterium]|nr:hypothetical protein [Gammaproteobacteria bacterium]